MYKRENARLWMLKIYIRAIRVFIDRPTKRHRTLVDFLVVGFVTPPRKTIGYLNISIK